RPLPQLGLRDESADTSQGEAQREMAASVGRCREAGRREVAVVPDDDGPLAYLGGAEVGSVEDLHLDGIVRERSARFGLRTQPLGRRRGREGGDVLHDEVLR